MIKRGGFLLALVLVACAEPSGAHVALDDGGITLPVRDAALLVLAEVAEPLPPEPVRFSPPESCAEGWQRVELGPTSYCRPFANQPPECGDTEMTLPGRGCVPVGRSCPEGLFASDTVDGALFVAPGLASTEDDGSREHPFRSIQRALDAAPDNGHVYVSAGVFSELLAIRRGIHLHGACAAGTVIETRLPGTDLVVRVIDGHLDNVSIRQVSSLALEGDRMAVVVAKGTLGDIIVSHMPWGIVGANEESTWTNVLVRDVRLGVVTGSTAIVHASNLSVRGVQQSAANVLRQSSLSMVNSFLEVDSSSLDREAVSLLTAIDTAHFSISQSALWKNGGIYLGGASTGALDSVHFERNDDAITLRTTDTSSLVADRVALIDSNHYSVFAQDDSNVTIRDAVLLQTDYWDDERRAPFRHPVSFPEGWGANGIRCLVNAEAVVERSFFSGLSNETLVTSLGAGTRMLASDIWVEDLSGDVIVRDGVTVRGGGAVVVRDGNMEVTRLHIRNAFAGAVVQGSRASLRDVTMDQVEQATTAIGTGGKSVTLELQRAHLVDVPQGPTAVSTDSTSQAHFIGTDLLISGTGLGINGAGDGATLELERVRVENFTHHAVMTVYGAHADVVDLSAIPNRTWADHGLELGAAVWLHDATASVERAELQGSWSVVVISSFSPSARLSLAEIHAHDSPVGVLLPVDGTARLVPTIGTIANTNITIATLSDDVLPLPTLPSFGF